jgi:hypothetical protein
MITEIAILLAARVPKWSVLLLLLLLLMMMMMMMMHY